MTGISYMWSVIRRETGLVEHLCDAHGVGHPNFYSAIRLNNFERENNTWLVHGCCGCCKSVLFPGREMPDTHLVNRIKWYIVDWNSGKIDGEELGRQMMYTGFDLGINAKLRKDVSIKEK